MTGRRFIEEHFPVRAVGDESSREKSIRHGHISTLHLWWARRPLAVSRATIYAALIPTPGTPKEVEETKREIHRLSKWSNPINPEMMSRAKARILAHTKEPPRVLDPFAGGGSIPLEALRLGCETYASDYNPVANLIVKAATVYPFEQPSRGGGGLRRDDFAPLASDVEKWSGWILREAKKDLGRFFPNDERGEHVGYLWSRSVPCQNPRCGATIPLIKQFWIANTKKKKIALLPLIKGKKVTFKIVGQDDDISPDFDPSRGTVSRGKATCLVCKNRMDGDKVKHLFAQSKNGEILNAVIIKNAGRYGKTYRIATKRDRDIFSNSLDALRQKRGTFKKKYGVDPIPDESTPEGKGSGAERAFSIRLYNMNTWGDLFNDRQKLVLLTFMEKIVKAAELMQANKDEDGIRALPYLGIILSRLADKNSNLAVYSTGRENIEHVFGRQALPMVWDYPEVNPFTSVGWPNMEKWVLRVLEHLKNIDGEPATVKHASATALPFPDKFFDAVVTDPPYYDNVPYSHLSDFFYVWLKRSIGGNLPSLFSTPLTPKSDEIVAYSNGPGGLEGGRRFFGDMLGRSFSEIHRVLKPDGISIIVYAHKSTDGWEALIESLLGAGLVVTAAWPIHTEMKARRRAKKSAALLSSIYMVCRKRDREPVGFYRDVKRDLKKYLDGRLDQLWAEGIRGADFFIAAIGSAIEVYGKYDRVMDDRDNDVTVGALLGDTRTMATNYAIDRVVRGEFADRISQMTRFYILWRWAHGEAKAPFDEALKLAQGVGVNLPQELGSGFLRKDKEYVRVVGPDERSDRERLEESDELIDILHHALRLWRAQRTEEAYRFLSDRGHGNSEVLKRVAQAVSESLSDAKGSREKDWIDGMFTGFEDTPQTTLF